MTSSAPPSRDQRTAFLLSALLVMLVAACLRPAITSVGPLLGEIQASTGLGEVELGALGSLPLLVFAVVSARVAGWSRNWGLNRTVLVALVTLSGGIVLRSIGGSAGLWIGTVVLSGAIAVGNVLVPAAVKEDFPRHTTLVTGIYTTTMGGVAALASGVAVPASHLLGGWQRSLLIWVLLPLIAAVLWELTRRRRAGTVREAGISQPAHVNVWRSRGAWGLTVFFGLQSASFYTILTWLPTIVVASGRSPWTGGWYLMLYQAVGVVGGLTVAWWMHKCTDLRFPSVAVSLPVIVSMAGMAVMPDLTIVWVITASAGASGALVVALALITTRTRTPLETAAVSGMAQSFGYLLAGAGPLSGGLLASLSGTWTWTLYLVAAVATVQSALCFWVGRSEPVLAHLPSAGGG